MDHVNSFKSKFSHCFLLDYLLYYNLNYFLQIIKITILKPQELHSQHMKLD